MFTHKKAVFSNDGELFAFFNEPGSLKIWETTTNTLKQEYDLSSHANLTCSTLIWGPSPSEIDENKVINSIFHSNNQHLVIGTEEGDIFLINYDEEKLSHKFETSHTGSVNDFTWQTDQNVLLSCSSDKCIAAWDLTSGNLKVRKWEADDEPINSLSVVDEDSLLSASTKILLWDIKTQVVLKKFEGHDSEIFALLTLNSTESALNSYFLSVAVGESKISAWHLKRKNSQSIIASFDVSHKIQSIDATKNFSKDKPMYLSTVTKEGSLLLFKHVLNGKVRKDLKPEMTLRVMAKPTAKYSKPSSIPVIASKFFQCSELPIIAYGSFENPVFEKVNIADCPKTLTLSRDKPSHHSNSNGVIPKKIFNKMGEFISTNGDLSDKDSFSPPKKRKQKSPKKEKQEPSLENSPVLLSFETMTAVTEHKIPSTPAKEKKQHSSKDKKLPKPIEFNLTDSSDLIRSLLQCLESENTNLFKNILSQIEDGLLIRNSVKNLPHSSLHSVLLELHNLLSSEDHRYKSLSRKWIKEILDCHLSYLKTNENTNEVIHELNKLLECQKVPETLTKINFLRGLLSIPRIKSLRYQNQSDTEEQMEV